MGVSIRVSVVQSSKQIGISKMFGLGELPKEYKPKVHGPHDPSVYYGPKDKALGNVKLTELPGWLARRNMYSPTGMARAMSRTYWRWNFKYMLPKYAGATGALQLTASACVFSTLSTARSTGTIKISNINGKASWNFVS